MLNSKFIQYLKTQSRLGIVPGYTGAIDEFNDAVKKAKDEFGDFIVTFQQMEQLEGIQKQIKANELLGETIKDQVAGLTALEERNKRLNVAFGVGSKIAAQYSQEFAKMAKQQKVGLENMKTYGIAVKKVVPFLSGVVGKNKEFYTGLTRVQQMVQTNLQLSEEAAIKFTGFAAQTGQYTDTAMYNSAKYVEQMEQATGMSIPFKDVVEEISKASEATQLQFGRMPGRLELAAVKAKSLGLSLDEVSKIGTQMLDIESSIGKELEYQLLSGHRLVDLQSGKSLTNMFREAALRGDASKQADSLNKILEQEGEVLENNLIARQKMADLLGMDEATLARAIQKRKILEKTGAVELFNLTGDELKTAASSLVKQGKMKAEDFEELMKSQDTRTTRQKMDEQIDLLSLIASSTFYTSQQQGLIGKGQDQVLGMMAKLKEGGAAEMVQMTDDELLALGQVELEKKRKAIGEKMSDTDTADYKQDLEEFTVTKTTPDFFMSPLDMPGASRGIVDFAKGQLSPFLDQDAVIGGTEIMNTPNTNNNAGGIDANVLAAAFVKAVKDHGQFSVHESAKGNYYSNDV